jgi:hypothetical protein
MSWAIWLVVIIIAIVLGIVLFAFVLSARANRVVPSSGISQNNYPQMYQGIQMPYNPAPPNNIPPYMAQVPSPAVRSSSVMRVLRVRPGMNIENIGPFIPPDLEDPITIPSNVPIFFNQKDCKICGKSINWSSRRSGWARCLATKRLVHGHCFEYAVKQDRPKRNWCAICDDSCSSKQPMRIEGRAF